MLRSNARTTDQRRECPYCKVLYASGLDRCPNCGKPTAKRR